MYELPTSVTVNDTEYTIRCGGDYRMVLDCFSALNDIEMGEDYRILASLIIFYEDFTTISDLPQDPHVLQQLAKEMMLFFNCGVEDDDRNTPKLIDWDTDANIIIAAINNVAGREVRSDSYTHWWTFMGYYMSIGESVLSTVVGIRNKMIKGNKKLEKWEKEYMAEHPKYFVWDRKTTEDRELDNLVHELWNSGV